MHHFSTLRNLLGLDRQALAQWLLENGEKPYRAEQILAWAHRARCTDWQEMTNISKPLRQKLANHFIIEALPLLSESVAADGTCKWLFDVGQEAIETVFIPEDDRNTLCVSIQVGCTVECAFCATGKAGFSRNLTVAEVIAQVWFANERMAAKGQQAVTNVVFMGMGEPLLNLDALLPALSLLTDPYAYGLSRRHVTVSTSGFIPGMDALGKSALPVALAVSLHAPDDTLRSKLVPMNRKYPLAVLLDACRRYIAVAPRNELLFEYVLLQDINDSLAHAEKLAKLLSPLACKVNLIPFNPFVGSSFQAPPWEQTLAFQSFLKNKGIFTSVRKRRGDEVVAACGQLSGQVQDRTKRTERNRLSL
jgi:23S rRNA (adenine2503-C2)-methyltransferase